MKKNEEGNGNILRRKKRSDNVLLRRRGKVEIVFLEKSCD